MCPQLSWIECQTPTLKVVRSNRIGHTKIFSPCYGRGKIFYSIVSTGNGFMFPTHWCKNAEAWFRFRLSWIFWLQQFLRHLQQDESQSQLSTTEIAFARTRWNACPSAVTILRTWPAPPATASYKTTEKIIHPSTDVQNKHPLMSVRSIPISRDNPFNRAQSADSITFISAASCVVKVIFATSVLKSCDKRYSAELPSLLTQRYPLEFLCSRGIPVSLAYPQAGQTL